MFILCPCSVFLVSVIHDHCHPLRWASVKLKFVFSQVPTDLQNEVLMSLVETDPDVVDHLLRRRASRCSWVSTFCLTEFLLLKRQNDQNKAYVMCHDYPLVRCFAIFISHFSAEIQTFADQRSSLRLKGVYPIIPSKHPVESCLPMTTTPLSCQIDSCQLLTVVHSQTGSLDFRGNSDSVTTQKKDLETPLP